MNHGQWLQKKRFDLASETKEGCIVELGSFRGRGTIVLARGARAGYGAHVYTIDDYTTKRGWANEPYGPKDKAIFIDNLRWAEVTATLIHKDVHEAAHDWDEPIGMLAWDIGVKGQFWQDWNDWSKHVVRGGVVLIRDTMDGRIGTFEKIKTIEAEGVFEKEDFGFGVTILRRK